MTERVLDSSDERRTLVLVVALRILRDPVLARLERDAPTIQALGSMASSGLVVALQAEPADRNGD